MCLFADVDEVDIEQKLDAVDKIQFHKFHYRSMADMDYDVLLTPPQSYLSQFTGLGQVKPKPEPHSEEL